LPKGSDALQGAYGVRSTGGTGHEVYLVAPYRHLAMDIKPGRGTAFAPRRRPAPLQTHRKLQRMADNKGRDDAMAQVGDELSARTGGTGAADPLPDKAGAKRPQRDPTNTLAACERILILGRTGSGKTTLARELAAALQVPHVELDSLYFGPEFSTAPLALLRERTSAAIAGDRWVTDGNKRAVRDLVWPRADTIVWLDYPLRVSMWRLAKRARWRTSVLKSQAAGTGRKTGLPRQLLAAARGVLTALRSHAGQRREFPRVFADPLNQHLAVVRLRSPRATRQWLARVTAGGILPSKPERTDWQRPASAELE
jgi:energy-coupling factor transporter ATP-binding protein EcfA2